MLTIKCNYIFFVLDLTRLKLMKYYQFWHKTPINDINDTLSFWHSAPCTRNIIVQEEYWALSFSRWNIYRCQLSLSLSVPYSVCLSLYFISAFSFSFSLFPIYYCLSKNSWSILYSNLLYNMSQDFLNIQYDKLQQ